VSIIPPAEYTTSTWSVTLVKSGLFTTTVWDATLTTSACTGITTDIKFSFSWLATWQYLYEWYRDLDESCNPINWAALLKNNDDPWYFTCRYNCGAKDFNRTYIEGATTTVIRYNEDAEIITITESIIGTPTKTIIMTMRE